MGTKKIYLDTSIINFFYADDAPDFKKATIAFFSNYVEPHVYDVYVSDIVINEILKTKKIDKRKQLLQKIQEYELSVLRFTEEADNLAKKIYSRKNYSVKENRGCTAYRIGNN
jgi:predicted nucleic acid-binding protein